MAHDDRDPNNPHDEPGNLTPDDPHSAATEAGVHGNDTQDRRAPVGGESPIPIEEQADTLAGNTDS